MKDLEWYLVKFRVSTVENGVVQRELFEESVLAHNSIEAAELFLECHYRECLSKGMDVVKSQDTLVFKELDALVNITSVLKEYESMEVKTV